MFQKLKNKYVVADTPISLYDERGIRELGSGGKYMVLPLKDKLKAREILEKLDKRYKGKVWLTISKPGDLDRFSTIDVYVADRAKVTETDDEGNPIRDLPLTQDILDYLAPSAWKNTKYDFGGKPLPGAPAGDWSQGGPRWASQDELSEFQAKLLLEIVGRKPTREQELRYHEVITAVWYANRHDWDTLGRAIRAEYARRFGGT